MFYYTQYTMLPFQVEFKPGQPVYEQVVYAAKKAVVSGRLQPGDRFPSVRQLSQELKINPNTAHKVVAALIDAGLLEAMPGIGTVVAKSPATSRAERQQWLASEIEPVVVEAMKLSLELDDVTSAVTQTWQRLTKKKP